MTQKEKLIKSFMTIQSIKSTAQNLEKECREYSSTAAMYARNIINKCEDTLKIL